MFRPRQLLFIAVLVPCLAGLTSIQTASAQTVGQGWDATTMQEFHTFIHDLSSFNRVALHELHFWGWLEMWFDGLDNAYTQYEANKTFLSFYDGLVTSFSTTVNDKNDATLTASWEAALTAYDTWHLDYSGTAGP